jgi:hypothetical protein
MCNTDKNMRKKPRGFKATQLSVLGLINILDRPIKLHFRINVTSIQLLNCNSLKNKWTEQ